MITVRVTTMQVKKAGKIVLGADLTREEERALDIEIQKQLAEYDRKNSNEVDAMVLWILHTEFGFGEKRLKQFHTRFCPEMEALCKRYEMDNTDGAWLCTKKLLDAGIDISKWNEEISNDK